VVQFRQWASPFFSLISNKSHHPLTQVATHDL
jgi:hypothetical protein